MKFVFTTALVAALSAPASASVLTLVYTDTFTTQDAIYQIGSTPVNFTGNTPFKVVATFDSAAPAFHLPGFNAYVPLTAVLTVGGASYTMTDADVSIFDASNPFSPNLYAAGFIQNPAQDQEGFVADFSSVSTPFVVGNVVPTTFTGYNGTGFQPGSGNPPGCASTDSCTSYNNTPFHLVGSGGTAYLLTTAFRDSGPNPAATAAILSPEPSAFLLVLPCLAVFVSRRRFTH